MKEALSIRYGGLLIDAEECNYESFKHLGLVCPICKRSVFLVGAANRETHSRKRKDGTTTTVKECVVPSHFNHHPDVDKNQVLDCELRAQRISLATRQAIVAKARGQRQKTMQRHFWKIVRTSIKLHDIDDSPVVMKGFWENASIRSKEATERLYQILIDSLAEEFRKSSQVEYTKSSVEYGLEKWLADTQDKEMVPAKMRPLFKIWEQKLDLRMQALIVGEAIDFLCQKMQKPMLLKLVEQALYCWILSVASSVLHTKSRAEVLKEFNKMGREISDIEMQGMSKACITATRQLIGIDKEEFHHLFLFVRDDVVQSLSFVDWAGEFERLDKIDIQKLVEV